MTEATCELDRLLAAAGRLPQPEASAADQPAGPRADDGFLAALAALVWNVEPVDGRLPGGWIHGLLLDIDRRISAQLNEILHEPRFQALESAWRSVADLVATTNFRSNVTIDIFDASKEELEDDLESGSVDISETVPFRRLYLEEYDQFGGKPYAAIIGLYEFANTPRDLLWLRQIAKVAAVSHSAFIATVAPAFFGFDTAEELAAARDLGGLLRSPRYGAWHAFREAPESGYVGLVFPRYLVRAPWTPEPSRSQTQRLEFPFVEQVGGDGRGYLWGSAALLFARNMIRAFEQTGWCQNIRGLYGGGHVKRLPQHIFRAVGESVRKCSVEVALPDWSELPFAQAGFIPLLAKPDSDEACFFSCQSVKVPKRYRDQLDTERSQIHSSLAYTLSASRIAQYLKCIVRDNIGTTADAPYIQKILRSWLEGYVTTISSPDDKTLRFYPFKGARVVVEKAEGLVGKYNCLVSVSPHIQFEGIDVELRLESRIG